MFAYLSKFSTCLIVLISAFWLCSCNIDEVPDLNNTYLPDYEGNIAVLLVNDTLTFRDFLEENISDSSNYEIDAEERVMFSYTIESDFSLGDDFVSIPDFFNTQSVNSPISASFQASVDTVISFSQEIVFNFPAEDGEQLDSLYFSAGDFDFSLSSTFPVSLDYTFSTTSFAEIATGEIISISSTVDPSSPMDERIIDLEGYKSNLESEGDSNRFYIQLDISLHLAEGGTLQGNESIQIDVNILSSEYDMIFGSFGQDTFDIAEKRTDLSFFDDLGGTGIAFEAPSIEFSVTNGFGIPVGLDFSSMQFGYETGTERLTGAFADELQLIGASPVNAFGSNAYSTLVLDASNSNLRELLANSPNEIVIAPVGYTNLNFFDTNWIADTSSIEFEAKVSIPMKIQVNGFEYEQEDELDDLSDLEGTESLTLLISTENELPFDGELDLFMLDSTGAIINSLEGNVLFATPTSFQNDKVSEPNESRTEIPLDKTKIDDLIHAHSLRTVFKLNSYNSTSDEFVEVFADYQLRLKIGIAGTVSLDLNDN